MDIRELVKDSARTELIYWKDSYAKDFESELLRVEPDGKRKAYVVLRSTIFHPKSGGQPSDTGVLTTSSGIVLNVKKAMIVDEVVVHYGVITQGVVDQLKQGMKVKGGIDWAERYSAMRRHTAGHLFDHCLDVATGKSSKTVDSWLGDPCYVTYAGHAPGRSELERAVELEIDGIEKGLPVTIQFVSYKEMLKIAGDAPNIARLPESDLMRVVRIEGCKPIPCGGTHVQNTNEIGRFELRKLEEVDVGKAFRVYYDVI